MTLKKCNSCVIYKPGSESDILIKARVVCDDDTIHIYFGDENIKEHGLENYTDRIRIDFFDNQAGQIKTFCKLVIQKNTDSYISEAWAADCKVLETIEVLQRQQDLRVDLNQETLFSSKGHGYFSGTIHNISVGGLYLTTDTRLEKDEQLEFQYCFMMKLLKVRAAVLRETVIRDNYYGYGCLFVNLSNGAEKDIRQFVYRQQRKNSNSYE